MGQLRRVLTLKKSQNPNQSRYLDETFSNWSVGIIWPAKKTSVTLCAIEVLLLLHETPLFYILLNFCFRPMTSSWAVLHHQSVECDLSKYKILEVAARYARLLLVPAGGTPASRARGPSAPIGGLRPMLPLKLFSFKTTLPQYPQSPNSSQRREGNKTSFYGLRRRREKGNKT